MKSMHVNENVLMMFHGCMVSYRLNFAAMTSDLRTSLKLQKIISGCENV